MFFYREKSEEKLYFGGRKLINQKALGMFTSSSSSQILNLANRKNDVTNDAREILNFLSNEASSLPWEWTQLRHFAWHGLRSCVYRVLLPLQRPILVYLIKRAQIQHPEKEFNENQYIVIIIASFDNDTLDCALIVYVFCTHIDGKKRPRSC